MRSSNPCDGCSLRRVRCRGGHPCEECQTRSVTCTFLRTRRKRGPKGPRADTNSKIERYQSQLRAGGGQGSRSGLSNQPMLGPATEIHVPTSPHRITLEIYESVLKLYHQRLYTVWPLVCHKNLMSCLRKDETDHENFSLASALCAATVAQLRLPEHTLILGSASSEDLETEVRRRRNLFEYREHYSLTSLLTSFFLHVYFANVNKLRTAGFYLREALTYVHGLELHRTGTYEHAEPIKRQLMLRVYWILFVSERTYCIQNKLPVTLNAINLFPDAKMMEEYDSTPLPAFLSLVRLFTCLEDQFLEANTAPIDFEISNEPSKRISALQGDLRHQDVKQGLNESQMVDISVTRSWIRILLWQYTISHFPVSCHAQDDAFSMFLPVSVSYNMLSLFAKASRSSIEPHGYGMELKIFRIADSLVDVLACTATSEATKNLLSRSRDSLHALESVLLTVGGKESSFVSSLRHRMAEAGLPVIHTLWAKQFCKPKGSGHECREVDQEVLQEQ